MKGKGLPQKERRAGLFMVTAKFLFVLKLPLLLHNVLRMDENSNALVWEI